MEESRSPLAEPDRKQAAAEPFSITELCCSGVCFLQRNVTKTDCLFLMRANESDEIHSSAELCLNRDCVGLNQMIIDVDIL